MSEEHKIQHTQSIISRQTNIYHTFNDQVKKDIKEDARQIQKYFTIDDMKNHDIKCPISLSTVRNIGDKYYDYLSIPTTIPIIMTVYNFHSIVDWFETNQWNKVPDPMRTFDFGIDFMIPKIRHIQSINDEEKTITIEQATDEFKNNILQKCIVNWRNGLPTPIHASLISLSTLELTNWLFKHMSAEQAENYLLSNKYSVGSFLIRGSSRNPNDGSGQATAIAISYVDHTIDSTKDHTKDSTVDSTEDHTKDHIRPSLLVKHIRFLVVHGVGVYRLTFQDNTNVPPTPICNALKYMRLTDIFQEIYEQGLSLQPQSSCIIQMLTTLHSDKCIELSKIVQCL